MNERPDSVSILGISYRIVGDELIGRERDCFGEFHGGRCLIVMDPALASAKQGDTLVHEIVECLDTRLGIDLDHGKLTALASGLTAVLRANVELIRRIACGEPVVSPSRATGLGVAES